MHAQNCQQLWTKAVEACSNDLPKTALENVKQLRQMAADERNYSQLLRALTTEFTIAHEISPDSDEVTIRLIEDALEKETRPIEKALWYTVLGLVTRKDSILIKAFDHPEMLAEARATDYVPAAVIGKDSRWFGNDMLSLIGMTILERNISYYSLRQEERVIDNQKILNTMRDIYKKQGNEQALLIIDHYDYTQYNNWDDSDDTKTELIKRIRTLTPAMTKKGENAAQHLKAWADIEETPTMYVNWEPDNNAFYPGNHANAVCHSRNVRKMELKFYLLEGIEATEIYDETDKNDLLKQKKHHLVLDLKKDLQHMPAHKDFEDTLSFTLPEAGIYAVELLADGKRQDVKLMHISRVCPIFFNNVTSKGKSRHLILVDRQTGKPFKTNVGLKIRRQESPNMINLLLDKITKRKQKDEWTEIAPNEEGTFDVTNYRNGDQFAFFAENDGFHTIEQNYTNNYIQVSTSQPNEKLAKIFTDRAIYRPGQNVGIAGFVYSRHGDDYNAIPNCKGTITLKDARDNVIAEKGAFTDEFGQFSCDFTLPSPTIPGHFSISLTGNGIQDYEYIRVEEYKRPTFQIKTEMPNSMEVTGHRQWEAGDSIAVKGKVETYSGIPIPETVVKWSVRRKSFWWIDSQNTEDDTLEAQEVTTDDKGCFVINFVPKNRGYYTIRLSVTASNGETHEARTSCFVGYKDTMPQKTKEAEEIFVETSDKDKTQKHLLINLAQLPGKRCGEEIYIFTEQTSTNGSVVERQCQTINADKFELNLVWNKKYGDGASINVCFIHNYTFYNHTISVTRPEPEKTLKLEWTSFRNCLQPGENETWTLNVKHHDGTPAKATVMARLYDASLDAFNKIPWRFNLYFFRPMPYSDISFHTISNHQLYYFAESPEMPDLDLTHLEPLMLNYYAAAEQMGIYKNMGTGRRTEQMVKKKIKAQENMLNDTEGFLFAYAPKSNMALRADAGTPTGALEESAEIPTEEIRKNFDETAFFKPIMRTNEEGNATIEFKLPESLTQWNFTALAHDEFMNYGLLNDTIIAKKQLMVEIAAPRFLREGDTTEVPVTVRNLDEKDGKTEVTLIVTEAESEKVVKSLKQTINLKAGQSQTITFSIKAEKDFKVRAMAKNGGFTDGEERLIEVLDGREEVHVSIPFSAQKEGDINIDLSPLKLRKLTKNDKNCKPRLTVEYCADALWNVVRVIPQLIESEGFSATSWATNLYGIEMADYLAKGMADTAAKEMIDSLLRTKDIPALRYSAIDHLSEYQHGDGGFCWLGKFDSSLWITTDVSILLARIEKLTQSNVAHQMLRKALTYMEEEVAEIVKEMKKEDKNAASPRKNLAGLYYGHTDEVLVRYLYVRQLMGLTPNSDARYLLNLVAKHNTDLTMYGKSVVAEILSASHQKEAALALQSAVEHTVMSKEMGRYFDTERALNGWKSYKIPTQTMVIEALKDAKNFDHAREIIDEMKLWLLQSKRTQEWENSRASADATYTLLNDYTTKEKREEALTSLSMADYTKRVLTEKETAEAINHNTYNIKKSNNTLSWGAIHADYTLPFEMVEESSAGFVIERQWEVKRGERWMPISGSLKIGEHVRQIITIKAERDYDFVEVTASRAACLEPLHPLSGMTWQGGTLCYKMVRDSSNDYYFEHLAKGIHQVTEELIVDRAGQFATGIAHIECVYAPEFGGYAPSKAIFATSE